jgi:hypothetical protein
MAKVVDSAHERGHDGPSGKVRFQETISDRRKKKARHEALLNFA